MNSETDNSNEYRSVSRSARLASRREARKIAADMLRPMNQGLETTGSATRFSDYITTSYKPYLEGKATTTQSTYTGTLRKYILPVFGDAP